MVRSSVRIAAPATGPVEIDAEDAERLCKVVEGDQTYGVVSQPMLIVMVLGEFQDRRLERRSSNSKVEVEATFQQVGSFPHYCSKVFFAHTLVRVIP